MGVPAVVAVVLLAVIVGFASPAKALSPGDETFEPPGLEGRQTHVTLLTTQESDCTELAIVRGVTAPGARALVPGRYAITTAGSGELVTGRFQKWDYVCEDFSVDGQRYTPRTQISMGAIAVTSRDDVPVGPGHFYLVYLATDNPVLAARYQQVGLPATFSPGLSATVSDAAASPFEVSFFSPIAQYSLMAVSAMAPAPVPATGGPNLFHEGGSGEVLLSYNNKMLGTATGTFVTADYRQHEILAPIIALPRLLQIAGPGFAILGGDWDATVARLD